MASLAKPGKKTKVQQKTEKNTHVKETELSKPDEVLTQDPCRQHNG